MTDLLVKNCLLLQKKAPQDILIQGGVIKDIASKISLDNIPIIDADFHFVTSPFVDSHFHMDATLSYGLPRVNKSGTLLEGIKLWGELKPNLTADAIKERALKFCKWAIARGTLAIRSHVDVSGQNLLGVEALLDVREQMKDFIDIQLVAFPQDGLIRANCLDNLKAALDMGVDVVGGIPHFERTMEEGHESIRILCEIAEKRGLLTDLHCDETDDPMSRHVEKLALETTRLGLKGRVAGSHLTSLHSLDNYYFTKLISLLVEADLNIIANPLINITIQGRQDNYPKRRGLTRIPEQLNAGLKVAFGHDCVMDPWYPLGSHDMLEVAHMALHCCHMTGIDEMTSCFNAVTANAASILHLDNYGINNGSNGDLVVLQCKDPIEAIRLKPARLFVVRRGKVISSTRPVSYELNLGSNTESEDLLFKG
ncbi:cytosine deaminase [Paracoccaceae bacterium]|nr:cytosine deaminase [Paracoccaceae bacterium]